MVGGRVIIRKSKESSLPMELFDIQFSDGFRKGGVAMAAILNEKQIVLSGPSRATSI